MRHTVFRLPRVRPSEPFSYLGAGLEAVTARPRRVPARWTQRGGAARFTQGHTRVSSIAPVRAPAASASGDEVQLVPLRGVTLVISKVFWSLPGSRAVVSTAGGSPGASGPAGRRESARQAWDGARGSTSARLGRAVKLYPRSGSCPRRSCDMEHSAHERDCRARTGGRAAARRCRPRAALAGDPRPHQPQRPLRHPPRPAAAAPGGRAMGSRRTSRARGADFH